MKSKSKRKVQRTTCMYIKGIPTSLKSYYKAYCAKREITMSEDIMQHMKDTTRVARQIDEDKHEDDE